MISIAYEGKKLVKFSCPIKPLHKRNNNKPTTKMGKLIKAPFITGSWWSVCFYEEQLYSCTLDLIFGKLKWALSKISTIINDHYTQLKMHYFYILHYFFFCGSKTMVAKFPCCFLFYLGYLVYRLLWCLATSSMNGLPSFDIKWRNYK